MGEDVVNSLSMTDHQLEAPIVQIPEIKRFNHKLQQQLAGISQTDLDLKRVMNMATNDQTVFSSLSDILLQNSETIEEWYSTLPGGILLGLSIAIGILIIVSSVLGWKMHRMSAIVMVLSNQSRTAKADADLDLGETRKRDGPMIFIRSTTMATTQPSLQDVILAAIAWRDMVLYVLAATVMLLA